jgi:probable F420-dependent oxidoreductase
MSIRIGIGMFGWPFGEYGPQYLWDWIDQAENSDVDSIWLTDRIVSTELNLEPIVALSFIAARTKKMLIGTSVLALPLRNPTILAKEIATLDYLSGGRVLPAIGLGTEQRSEYEACGVRREERAARADEMLFIMRKLWSCQEFDFKGDHFTLNSVTIQPKPVRPELPPLWIGGRSKAALRRVAKLGDGWLASQVTPDEIALGKNHIEEMARRNGRSVDTDHYGVILNFALADTSETALALAQPYLIPDKQRKDINTKDINAIGTMDEVINLINRFVSAGATKFVMRPTCPPDNMFEQLSLLTEHIIPNYHQ